MKRSKLTKNTKFNLLSKHLSNIMSPLRLRLPLGIKGSAQEVNCKTKRTRKKSSQ